MPQAGYAQIVMEQIEHDGGSSGVTTETKDMPPQENLQPRHGLPALEAAARAALAGHIGRVLTDPEWARARHNLLDIARTLLGWEQRAEANEHLDRVANQQDKAA